MSCFLRIIIIITFESVSFPRSRRHSLYKSALGEEESLLDDSSCEAIFKALVICYRYRYPLNSNTQRYQGNTVYTSSKVVFIALCMPAKIRYFLLRVEFAILHTVLQCDIVVSRSEVLISVCKFELIFYLFIYLLLLYFLIRDFKLEFHKATLKSSVTITFICILIAHASLLIL